jgi:hypothetical protein
MRDQSESFCRTGGLTTPDKEAQAWRAPVAVVNAVIVVAAVALRMPAVSVAVAVPLWLAVPRAVAADPQRGAHMARWLATR